MHTVSRYSIGEAPVDLCKACTQPECKGSRRSSKAR